MLRFIIICAVVAFISLLIVNLMNNKPISVFRPDLKRTRSKIGANPQISIPTRPFTEDEEQYKSVDHDIHSEPSVDSSEFLNGEKVVDEAILVDIDVL